MREDNTTVTKEKQSNQSDKQKQRQKGTERTRRLIS